MRPTLQTAKEILHQAALQPQKTQWIKHSICVGETAGKLAQALNHRGYNLDVDDTMALGYLHDIGKLVDGPQGHLIEGYFYLKEQGYEESFCQIALIHHSICNDPFCTIGPPPDAKRDKLLIDCVRAHQFSLAERLIVFCDSLCKSKVVLLEKRIVDVISRYGTCAKTQERILKTLDFKTELDKMLGHNLYDLFPTVKDDL